MSFADELRDQEHLTQESIQTANDARYWCTRLIEAVKGGCRQAARAGKNGIYGYVYMYREDGYDEARFVEKLPSIKDFQSETDECLYENRMNTMKKCGSYETRLYEGYIIPGSADLMYKIEKLAGEELEKLGFKEYRVQKVMLRDIYIRHRQKTSLLSGAVTETKSTTTATKPVYTLHFSVSW